MNAAVFYDPLVSSFPEPDTRKSWETIKKKMEGQSAELLRAQVRDFIAWAKREGVLK